MLLFVLLKKGCGKNNSLKPYYWQADYSYANYLRKIDLVFDGADSITLNLFYKLRYYSIHLTDYIGA